MIESTQLFGFMAIALLLVLTPGPNMIYLISRSICQGKKAGLISLGGVVLGFVFYMLAAALGITALLFAVPYAYDVIRILGAVYLLWLAWGAIKPNAKTLFEPQLLQQDSAKRLFLMGFATNLLNPKIAIMYLSLLPQFIRPEQGHVFAQTLFLGFSQILVSIIINTAIVFTAGWVAVLLSRKPQWVQLQKWIMGTVLTGLAFKLLLEGKR
ncbi:lysine transporter LysE [Acinetobacter sp. ANC 4558]|uniref:LysE family translocator n=1 Tax=Acinetobacter sp. ANC 4558 TaxID=1977876 RepID=UPI000A336CBD|nr:LysE family translocator [Acinetobacter sp. ANC 4558]OTG85577.1 lysine transporter LysE [Acinetobacter sp. ANC 4558]